MSSKPRLPAAGHRDHTVNALLREEHPLTGGANDYDPLLELIGDASLVLLGEASHGTHEFYRERALITRRLIEEKGFTGVAVEADWPDAYRVNRYVRGAPEAVDAEEALRGFQRFPTWMWRNAEVLDFVGWLRAHNDLRDPADAVGYYGLDLYSLYASIEEVISYLERIDPPPAARARERYACFEHFAGEGQEYGRAVILGVSESCRRVVVEQLLELHRNSVGYLRLAGRSIREKAKLTAGLTTLTAVRDSVERAEDRMRSLGQAGTTPHASGTGVGSGPGARFRGGGTKQRLRSSRE